MPYFKVDKSKIDLRFPTPDDEYFKNVIFENNKKFSVVTSMFPNEALVLDCENKPRDMPVFGIFWLEAQIT